MPEISPDWRRRGYVARHELVGYFHLSDNEIFQLLESNEASDRTIAASILGFRKNKLSVNILINALKKEKALYPKIAISEALGKMGKFAVNDLILLFAKIGKNQHKTLPVKPFEKWNYPLPRDIAARTISKIGISALNPIVESIPMMDKKAISEAIDAIGFISFYHKNQNALAELINLLDFYKNDYLIIWKIIRSLQSFPASATEKILDHFLKHNIHPAIRCEAARSLAQICKKPTIGLISATNDKNELLRKISLLAIERILLTNKNNVEKRYIP